MHLLLVNSICNTICNCMCLSAHRLFMCVIQVSCYCNSSPCIVLVPNLLYLYWVQPGNGKEVISVLLLPCGYVPYAPLLVTALSFQHYITAGSLCINSGGKNFPSSICRKDEELFLHTCGCAPFI